MKLAEMAAWSLVSKFLHKRVNLKPFPSPPFPLHTHKNIYWKGVLTSPVRQRSYSVLSFPQSRRGKMASSVTLFHAHTWDLLSTSVRMSWLFWLIFSSLATWQAVRGLSPVNIITWRTRKRRKCHSITSSEALMVWRSYSVNPWPLMIDAVWGKHLGQAWQEVRICQTKRLYVILKGTIRYIWWVHLSHSPPNIVRLNNFHH